MRLHLKLVWVKQMENTVYMYIKIARSKNKEHLFQKSSELVKLFGRNHEIDRHTSDTTNALPQRRLCFTPSTKVADYVLLK